jgi:uncharacterized protein YecE (DUF72 family)
MDELGPILRTAAADVLTGTCSWTDKTLVKDANWYPKKSMSAAERLAFYAARYPIAEADSTYYFPPGPELARTWVANSPPGFTMNVKAYSLLTGHPTNPQSLWPDLREAIDPAAAGKRNVYAHHLPEEAIEEAWRRFAFALEPLREARKLGAVLFQYPEWFVPRHDNREELRRLPGRLPGVDICVELRSPKWLETDQDRDRTLGLLRELGLAHVVVDAPPASGLPTVVEVTSPRLAVVRFHGRSDATWKKPGTTAAERFRYLYDTDELRSWVPRIHALAERAGQVHALMNNCYEDYGVRNAADLRNLLEQQS